jgi:hypothetical protein
VNICAKDENKLKIKKITKVLKFLLPIQLFNKKQWWSKPRTQLLQIEQWLLLGGLE